MSQSVPHPEWIKTDEVDDTGEKFGVLTEANRNSAPVVANDDGGVNSDESLRELADDAEDEVLDLDTPADRSDLLKGLTSSQAWLAKLHNRRRATSKVTGRDEWAYFNSNIARFQGRSNEADNYCNFRFSDMAKSWNEWVDSLGEEKPSVTYKNAAYLHEAYKNSLKNATRHSTMRPHSAAVESVRQQHTDMLMNQPFVSRFAESESASISRPVLATQRAEMEDEADDADVEQEMEQQRVQRRRKRPRQSSGHRCRTCGHEYKHPTMVEYHKVPLNQDYTLSNPGSKHLPNQTGSKVFEHCAVPVDMRLEGFPVPVGEPMPRKKK